MAVRIPASTPQVSSAPAAATTKPAVAQPAPAKTDVSKPASQFKPAATSTTPAARAALESQATAAEAQVMQTATQLAASTSPATSKDLQLQLQGQFGLWRSSVDQLVKLGALDSPAVKSFSAKVEQSELVQHNMPDASLQLTGTAYRDAALKQAALDCVATKGQTLQSVVAANPLIAVPPMAPELGADEAKARGISTTNITNADGKPATVRQDVVMVFCPGVVHDKTQLHDQTASAEDAGIYAEVANTGTFIDPDENAKAIAQAVKDARAKVGNPDAKVLLVGYSQGCTNALAFMKDDPDLAKSVVGIHFMHSAAGGSQQADLAYAVGNWLAGTRPLTDSDRTLLDAFCGALVDRKILPGPPQDVVQGFRTLHVALAGVQSVIQEAGKLGSALLRHLGVPPIHEADVGKATLNMLQRADEVHEKLMTTPGPLQPIAQAVNPFWQTVLGNTARKALNEGVVNYGIQTFLDGGLHSLTTHYAQQLQQDPALQQSLAKVPLLNSVGAVPPNREDSLVPPSQRLGYAFFQALGLDSDYQVSVQNQKLEGSIKNAVDLPPEAVGHWGVAGVIVPHDHGPEFYSDYKTTGLTRSVLDTWGALGII